MGDYKKTIINLKILFKNHKKTLYGSIQKSILFFEHNIFKVTSTLAQTLP
jgi:hypothetical protein